MAAPATDPQPGQNVSFERGGRTIKLTFTPIQSIDAKLKLCCRGRRSRKSHWRKRSAQSSDATILIADDMMIHAKSSRPICARTALPTLFCKDGEDALEQVRKHNPDLIT
ncbi:hypothetical protein [Thalassospira alkalitolerans]|uniref:hypothetical protein n=1 Tax=Thalassospira alkalitolerans TaxID=1293890 RepID=UPI003AA7AF8A